MNKAKRLMAILLMIAVAFTFTACGDSQKKTYESASNLLNKGKYAEAAEKFEKLGSYEDASQMTMYAKALNEAESGNYEVALKTFDSLGAFKDAPQMISYYTARELEDWGFYEKASEQYNENPLFKDSQERSLNCLYQLAAEESARGRYDDAIALYRYLDDYKDSKKKVSQTQTAKQEDMYSRAAECVENEEYDKALELYQQLGSYKDSSAKAAEIQSHRYFEVNSSQNGYFTVYNPELRKWGFIDTTGKLVIPCKLDDTYPFREGLVRVEKDGKYGFIDTTGKLVVPCEWDDAYSFRDGLACVEKDDKWGFIDTTGELVIPCEWDSAYSNGYIALIKNGYLTIVDKEGNRVF